MAPSTIEQAVESGDWSALAQQLSELDPAGRAAAARWYTKSGRSVGRRLEATQWSRVGEPTSVDRVAVVGLLAAQLAPTAEEAARWFGFTSWSSTRSVEADGTILEALAARGSEWCAEFATTAGNMKLAPVSGHNSDRVARVLTPLVAHFDLASPEGPNYSTAWAEHYVRLRTRALPSRYEALRGHEKPNRVDRAWLTPIGSAQLDVRRLDEVTMVDLLAEEPHLADALSGAIGLPKALADLASEGENAKPEWDFGQAIARFVDAGRLDRERVVDECLDALARRDTPRTQKTVAQILAALHLTQDDLAGRLQLVQTLLAIAHGTATAVLLAPALACIGDAESMGELASTIFGRTEKKQQAELLAALTGKDATSRFGADAIAAGLRAALHSSDLRIARTAAAALDVVGAESESTATSTTAAMDSTGTSAQALQLWRQTPEPFRPGHLRHATGSLAALTRLESQLNTFTTPVDESQFLQIVTELALNDPAGLRAWIATHDLEKRSPICVLDELLQWYLGNATPPRLDTLVEQLSRSHGPEEDRGRPTEIDFGIWSLSPTAAFRLLLVRETMLRLGNSPGLLSTPSLVTGVLLFDELRSRLREYRGTGFGQFDLFQALLRLEPVDPNRARELDGLRLPMNPSSRRSLFGRQKGRPTEVADAVDLARAWIRAGGAKYPDAAVVDGRLVTPPLELPVDPNLFAGVPGALVMGHRTATARRMHSWNSSFSNSIGVVPLWPEYIAAQLEPEIIDSKYLVPWVRGICAAGRAGPGVHTIIARTLSYRDAGSRLHGVDAALLLIARGAFDSELFAATCIRLSDAGELPLARTADALEQVILGGGLSSVWPSIIRLADYAITARQSPSGLAEWLALIRRHLTETPGAAIPLSIRELAKNRERTKAGAEADAIAAIADARSAIA